MSVPDKDNTSTIHRGTVWALTNLWGLNKTEWKLPFIFSQGCCSLQLDIYVMTCTKILVGKVSAGGLG